MFPRRDLASLVGPKEDSVWLGTGSTLETERGRVGVGCACNFLLT